MALRRGIGEGCWGAPERVTGEGHWGTPANPPQGPAHGFALCPGSHGRKSKVHDQPLRQCLSVVNGLLEAGRGGTSLGCARRRVFLKKAALTLTTAPPKWRLCLLRACITGPHFSSVPKAAICQLLDQACPAFWAVLRLQRQRPGQQKGKPSFKKVTGLSQ